MNPKKGIVAGVIFAFLVMGVLSMQRALPEIKEARIYEAIKVYSPYKLEKRMGGLTIVDTQSGTKEKPSAAEVMHRLDEVEKEWGRTHLKIVGNDVLVLGENNQTVIKIFIETEQERAFVEKFYGL